MSGAISVVICAYSEERWERLEGLLAALRRQTTAAEEIIVVVDHNRQLLERARRLEAHVVENTGSPGAAAARNVGAAVARGEVIAFVDDDVEAEADWLEELIRGYEPDVLGVGGFIEPAWLGGRPAWFPKEFDWVVGCSYIGLPRETAAVRNLIAANMSVRRDVFVALGGFRAGFGNVKAAPIRSPLQPRFGDEETDFCIRALQRWPDARWLYHPRARVSHHVPRARATLGYFLARCFDEGLGKAMIVQSLGTEQGLGVERGYVRRILPRGILQGLGDALVRGDRTGLERAAAIVAGLLVASAGYALGRCRSYLALRPMVLKEHGGAVS